MKRNIILMFSLFLSIITPPEVYASKKENIDHEAIRLVERAVAHIKTYGKDASIKTFLNPSEPFIGDDLTIIVTNDTRILVHKDPRKVNQYPYNVSDIGPVIYSKKNKGWIHYKVRDQSNKVSNVSIYFEKYDDMIILCAFHK